MGPRSIERGTPMGRVGLYRDERASMGPRSIDRGTIEGSLKDDAIPHASMGPRSIDRGTHDITFRHLDFSGLQWGRDQLIAELEAHCWVTGQVCRLQWGRDQLIAELGQIPGVRPYQLSFNGAAIN